MNRPTAKAFALALSLPLLLAACGDTTASQPDASQPSQTQPSADAPAPDYMQRGTLEIVGADNPDAIEGQYIVVLAQPSGDLSAQSAAAELGALGGPELTAQAVISALGLDPQGADIGQLYSHALRGFAGKLSAQNVESLRHNPAVKYIEQDARVQASATQYNPRNWGLDRIDQRGLPLNSAYSYGATGRGVTAYIVDSGINVYHQDFGGRASWGGNATGDGKNYDCSGHGTHVAGTVGGASMGVAKGVNLVGVKVLGCNGFGSTSGIVAGLDWVRGQSTGGRKVINISINGSGSSRAYADAINRLAYAGVPVVNSAANKNDNACYYGPADVPAAIVVAATDIRDRRASFSNYGSCVDLFAPGSDILSTSSSSNSGYQYMSGTSMAAPHVAGAVARLLEARPDLSVAQVEQYLIDTSTKNVVYDPKGSPNRLLYVAPDLGSSDGGHTGPTNPTPPTEPEGKTYSAYLNAGQNAVIHQNGVRVSGEIQLQLSAGSSTDFDLYLQRWDGYRWVTAAASEGSTSSESLRHTARGEYYRIVVYAYAGSSEFVLKTNGM